MKGIGKVVLALILACSPALAKKHSSSSGDNAKKTEHVRSYTKKNGTHVDSYNRRPRGEAKTGKTSKHDQ